MSSAAPKSMSRLGTGSRHGLDGMRVSAAAGAAGSSSPSEKSRSRSRSVGGGRRCRPAMPGSASSRRSCLHWPPCRGGRSAAAPPAPGWPPGRYSELEGSSSWPSSQMCSHSGPSPRVRPYASVGDQFERLGVAALGVDFEQLAMDGDALRRRAHRFLEDFLGLQVAAVGQVHVGFGHRIHVAGGVELAGRIHHGRAGGAAFVGVDALAAAGAEERIGLQAAFQEGAVDLGGLLALLGAVEAKAQQQGQHAADGGGNDRVFQQVVDQAWSRRPGPERRPRASRPGRPRRRARAGVAGSGAALATRRWPRLRRRQPRPGWRVLMPVPDGGRCCAPAAADAGVAAAAVRRVREQAADSGCDAGAGAVTAGAGGRPAVAGAGAVTDCGRRGNRPAWLRRHCRRGSGDAGFGRARAGRCSRGRWRCPACSGR